MPTNILMPALSPTMSEGNLAKWHVKVGDTVKAGDVVAEIETDKATMEVEAVDEGKVGQIVVPAGTEGVQVNAVIAVLLNEGEDASAIKAEAKVPTKQPVPAAPAAAAAPAATAASAPKAAAPASAPSPAPAAAGPATNGTAGNRVFATPLARRLAKTAGIDLASISGSGPHGRIVKADVENPRARTGGAVPAAPSAVRGMTDAQILQLYEAGSYDVVPHDNVRRIIARRLVEAKTTIPHFYLTVDVETDALIKLRADLNELAPRDAQGNAAWKVSLNDLIIKAFAKALMAVPDANATWTEGGMLRHKRADIGVAVSIPSGLITPIVRHAEEKSVAEIATEMKDLAGRARERRLKPEEYQGGSTAISNLGMFGIKEFAAVINPPHSSILAVGAGVETAIVRKGQIEVATIMQSTLSTDHRAVDGVLGAKLLTAFKNFIEKPASLLL